MNSLFLSPNTSLLKGDYLIEVAIEIEGLRLHETVSAISHTDIEEGSRWGNRTQTDIMEQRVTEGILSHGLKQRVADDTSGVEVGERRYLYLLCGMLLYESLHLLFGGILLPARGKQQHGYTY